MNRTIDPAAHKVLFLDDQAIESAIGLRLTLHQPEKQGAIICPDRSRDQTLVQSATVPQWNSETDSWEWWYAAFYGDAPYQGPGTPVWADYHYATSTDGVDWNQPSLGLYEWRGSKDNNLAYYSKMDFLRRRGQRNPVDIAERRFHHILRDERDPDPARRYKGLFSNSDNLRRYPALSPDGFKWTFPHVVGIQSEDTSAMLYDDICDQFVATVKQRTEWGRSVWLSTSKDFVEWTTPELVLRTDEVDRENRRERIHRVIDDPAYLSPPVVDDDTDYIAQLYMMPLMTYEGLYIGFPLLLNPAGPDLPQMNHCGLNQTELAVSRDLYHWDRVADRAIFIGIEPWDGITYDTAQVAVCGSPIVRNGEIWIYYEGARFRGLAEIYPEEYEPYFKDFGALQLAKLRLDGFVSLDAEGLGSLVTKPFRVDGSTLHVNVDAKCGQVVAEIVDAETLHPLPGLTLAECNPLSVDDIDKRITWLQGARLDSERPIRVRFELRNAKLYAFWLRKA